MVQMIYPWLVYVHYVSKAKLAQCEDFTQDFENGHTSKLTENTQSLISSLQPQASAEFLQQLKELPVPDPTIYCQVHCQGIFTGTVVGLPETCSHSKNNYNACVQIWTCSPVAYHWSVWPMDFEIENDEGWDKYQHVQCCVKLLSPGAPYTGCMRMQANYFKSRINSRIGFFSFHIYCLTSLSLSSSGLFHQNINEHCSNIPSAIPQGKF